MKASQFYTDIKKGRKETRKNQRQKYAVRFEALEILSQAHRDAELCPSVTEILKQNLFAKVEKKSKKQTVLMKQTQKSLVDRLKAFVAAKKNERRIENLIEKVTSLSTEDMNEDIDEITKTMVSSMVLDVAKDSEMMIENLNQNIVSSLSKLSVDQDSWSNDTFKRAVLMKETQKSLVDRLKAFCNRAGWYVTAQLQTSLHPNPLIKVSREFLLNYYSQIY